MYSDIIIVMIVSEKMMYLTYRYNSQRYYHSRSGCNDNKGILHAPQSSRTGPSQPFLFKYKYQYHHGLLL